jgi:hypothetical protein
MKKSKFMIFGMLAMVLALGLVFAGCDPDPDGGGNDLNGTTWKGRGFNYQEGPLGENRIWTLTFNSSAWLMVREDGGNIVKGTYSVSGSNVTFTTTNQWDEKGAAWEPATGSFLPQTGAFTDSTMTIVFSDSTPLTYTKQ